jgi:excisionase family DNA binding protein
MIKTKQKVNPTRRSITTKEFVLIAKAFSNKCVYCGTKDSPFELDHIVPKSCGGSCSVANLCLSCKDCNRKKSYKRLPYRLEIPLLNVAKENYVTITNQLKDNTLMTLGDAARLTGISKPTISKAISNGRISANKVDGVFQIAKEELTKAYQPLSRVSNFEPMEPQFKDDVSIAHKEIARLNRIIDALIEKVNPHDSST